jgi:putative lipoprotein
MMGNDFKQLLTTIAILGLLWAADPVAAFAGNVTQGSAQTAADPLNATYSIEGMSTKMEKVIQGWLTIGHEVRTLTPCDAPSAIWLMGRSPAMQAVLSAYRRALPDGKPYQPVIAVLSGKFVAPPTDGFGADYEAAFLATRLVRIAPDEDCSTVH